MLKIIARPVEAKELEPGDLFSPFGQGYWSTYQAKGGHGEKVYIRTEQPLGEFEDELDLVYRITIEKAD
jgi:hypothetical protein